MKPITEFLVNNRVNAVQGKYPAAKSFEDLRTNDACYFKIDTHYPGSKSSILMGISAKKESDANYIYYKIAINKGLTLRVNDYFGNDLEKNEYLPLTRYDLELLNDLNTIYVTKFDDSPMKGNIGTVSGASDTGWDVHVSK